MIHLGALDDQRERLKRVVFRLLRLAGREEALYRRLDRRRSLIVLNPHQIRPEPNPFWGPLHPRLFEELLRFIAPRFFVTTFERLAENDTDKPSLVLSFDDGYQDWVEHALPLLDRYKLPCNQNVIGASVVTGKPPAVVRVCDFLGQAPRKLLDEIALPGFNRKLGSDSDRQKTLYGIALCEFLKSRPRDEAAPLWEAMDRQIARLDSFVPSAMMSAETIRAVAKGHEIGAHSYSHESMAFETDAYFAEDFARCKAVFDDVLHLPLRTYAFPNGSYREAQVDWLHAQGVPHVLLVGDDYSSLQHGSPYKRFNFYASSRSEARLRALGFSAPAS